MKEWEKNEMDEFSSRQEEELNQYCTFDPEALCHGCGECEKIPKTIIPQPKQLNPLLRRK